MIYNYIIVRDYETGSRNPYKTQPVELASVVIDPRSLSIVEGSCFSSLIKPEYDEKKLTKLKMEPIEDDALKINHLTKEQLEEAPSLKQVWKDYTNYIKKFCKGKGVWTSPMVTGFNSVNFDDIIDERLCQQFGPKLTERNDIPFYYPTKFDVLPVLHMIFNNCKINSRNQMSLDVLRDYFGIDKEGAHGALKDSLDTAFILIKLLKLFRGLEAGNLNLPIGTKVSYQNSFEIENEIIRKLLSNANPRNQNK